MALSNLKEIVGYFESPYLILSLFRDLNLLQQIQ